MQTHTHLQNINISNEKLTPSSYANIMQNKHKHSRTFYTSA